MSTEILEKIADAAEKAGGGFHDAWALLLLIAPFALFIGYVIVYFSNKNARGKGKAAFLAFCDVCVFAFAGLAVCAFAPSDAVRAVIYIGVALSEKAVLLVLYGALSLFPKNRPVPKERKQRLPEGEYIDMSDEFPPAAAAFKTPEPKKVRCFTDPEFTLNDDCEAYASDVRLDHIFSVIERLKGVSLGAGDRLEVQKYEDLLTVYKNKNALSSEEAQTLNDILASLLKMMAKYDL